MFMETIKSKDKCDDKNLLERKVTDEVKCIYQPTKLDTLKKKLIFLIVC